jgi:PEP-CTERM motif-containing protein
LANQPEAGNLRTAVRRRRTSRHRRNRLLRRALLGVVLIAFGFGLSKVVLQHLSPSLFHASVWVEPDRRASEASRDVLLLAQQEALGQMESRLVYPYSVVPGGVKDASELKWAAEHDPVVAAHYAGFDYDHARVVRLVLERTAYVSYRIGKKIYWTRRRIKLKKGETVITDGRITARTRCANRVEEVPQQANSSSEPPVVALDQPMSPAMGPANQTPPVPFQSALLNPPPGPGVGPAPPLSVFSPFGGGIWIPIAPPPLPGVCGVGKKQTGTGGGGKKGKGNPCGTGTGSEVPEPGTWVLLAAGLSLLGWKARRGFAKT